jgi:signal transduction histidine kinase
MAEMARALGHEVNNTLAATVLRIEMLAQDVPRDSPAQESVAVIEEATRQGIALVRRVRDFARLARPLVPRPVDVATAVMEALRPLRERVATLPSVEIVTELGAVPSVSGDAAELTLAVSELIGNALDAVTRGGTRVRIATGKEGGEVLCQVADDGPGIGAEDLPHVFDPFFTTSGQRGRGLGLTIALSVATRHDGDLRLVPAAGRGVVATLRLPCAR